LKKHNPKANLFYLPEAINKIYFTSRADYNSKNLVFIGNLGEIKDPITAIKIVKYISDKYPDIKLNFIGSYDSKYLKKLKSIIKDLKIEEKIDFKGFLKPNEIIQVFEESSIFLLTSIIENSPNSLLEAMASGLCVIANNTGGVSSLIKDGVNGFLINRKNVEETGELIINLFENKKKLEDVGQKAKEDISLTNFPTVVAAKYIETYKEIIKKEST